MNQKLSIKARKEFGKGNVDKAWEMTLESECLAKEISKEQWVKYEAKCLKESEAEEAKNAILHQQIASIN